MSLERTLHHFPRDPASRQVRLAMGDKPAVTISGKTLVVSFAPAAGVAGHASSREVALELGKMLQVAEAG